MQDACNILKAVCERQVERTLLNIGVHTTKTLPVFRQAQHNTTQATWHYTPQWNATRVAGRFEFAIDLLCMLDVLMYFRTAIMCDDFRVKASRTAIARVYMRTCVSPSGAGRVAGRADARLRLKGGLHALSLRSGGGVAVHGDQVV